MENYFTRLLRQELIHYSSCILSPALIAEDYGVTWVMAKDAIMELEAEGLVRPITDADHIPHYNDYEVVNGETEV